jgi:hypothetical protein
MTASVALHPVSGGANNVSLWLSVSAVATAFVALAVWFVVTVSTAHNSTSTTPSVQQGGGAGQHNQLCVPTPGTRYC